MRQCNCAGPRVFYITSQPLSWRQANLAPLAERISMRISIPSQASTFHKHSSENFAGQHDHANDSAMLTHAGVRLCLL